MVSLNFAEITFLASPWLILWAMEKGVVPFSTSFTAPSGSVIFIMLFKLLFFIIERTKIIPCIDATRLTFIYILIFCNNKGGFNWFLDGMNEKREGVFVILKKVVFLYVSLSVS